MFYTNSLLKEPDMFFYRMIFDDNFNEVKNDPFVIIPKFK